MRTLAEPADNWDAPARPPPGGAAPVLAVDGFEGPLDWLLEMARAQRIDLARLYILALVEAFLTALDAALAGRRTDLSRWGEWLVMAATLTLLRSRLLLPKDAPEARAAQDEAEALRRSLLGRAAMQQAAAWLERRPQLGRDAFARGGAEPAAAGARVGDITELLRACLIVLRVPDQVEAYRPHRPPFWRVADAAARITRMLAGLPHGGELRVFLPAVADSAPERALRCLARWRAPSWQGSSWRGKDPCGSSKRKRGRTLSFHARCRPTLFRPEFLDGVEPGPSRVFRLVCRKSATESWSIAREFCNAILRRHLMDEVVANITISATRVRAS